MRSGDLLPLFGAIAFAIGFLLLVLRALAHARQQGRPLPRKRSRQYTLFMSGFTLLLIALALPAHSVLLEMIAHTLLAFLAAPLLLLGLPRATLLPLFEHARPRRFMQLITRPSRAVSAFVIAISASYLPHVLDPVLATPALQ
ncbi:MAG: cytochrome c oxidase assembly protein, partial [Chloroflexi bacterium]|nr:cytochrome c oxidase assembly protein [Chloroflexota bacterium]